MNGDMAMRTDTTSVRFIKKHKITYMKHDVEELLICQCCDIDHMMVISYDHDENEAYVDIHLYRERNIFKRIWIALKFVFSSKKSIYGDFDEIILRPEDADKLQRVVDHLRTVKE